MIQGGNPRGRSIHIYIYTYTLLPLRYLYILHGIVCDPNNVCY